MSWIIKIMLGHMKFITWTWKSKDFHVHVIMMWKLILTQRLVDNCCNMKFRQRRAMSNERLTCTLINELADKSCLVTEKLTKAKYLEKSLEHENEAKDTWPITDWYTHLKWIGMLNIVDLSCVVNRPNYNSLKIVTWPWKWVQG